MEESRIEKLDDLYRKYAKGLYYYLLRLSGSPSVAEDLVQETFLRATISLSFYRDEDVRPWLYRIARNIYIDEWRRRQRWKWVPFISKDEMISPYGVPEQEAITSETARELADLLALLPENYRTILYLREYEAFTYSELEEALGLTGAQVKVQLYRARQKLKQLGAKEEFWHDRMDEG
ncbi:sigma-70 family RNA polymerase sigma factor [Neobacillus notoginsengisoli]|uniref:sigma-70 family RNA polymerase sigma factor n=1 Tax=Neobacillus notoginsengisoli TaxID=1578198 RepID=UPI001EFFFD83|nr:sigma-70 family RNA polymerase sigma factor [Neobacillus notoginsengisoli]